MSRHAGTSKLLPGALWVTLAVSALVHGIGLLAVDTATDETARPPLVIEAQLVERPTSQPPVPTPMPLRSPRQHQPAKPVIVAEPPTTETPVVLSRVQAAPNFAPPPTPVHSEPTEPDPIAVATAETTALSVHDRKPLRSMPARILLSYELRSSLVDGRAEIRWRKTADQGYVIDGGIEANGFFATMFAGRLEQESRGKLTENGIRPDHFSLRRGDAPAEFAEFKWEKWEIRQQRTRGEHTQALSLNGQDLLSFLFQFGFEFDKPVTPTQVAFTITNARKMDLYEFRLVGKETLVLPIGEMETLHVTRNTGDPAETYDAWLAPTMHYLPVKLMFKLGGRVQVEQLANRVTIDP